MKFVKNLLLVSAMSAGLSQTVPAAVTFTNTPVTVSNTYSGVITLQIGGLTNTETVVVQKFLDLNNNGVVDSGDYLVQQFTLTDGQPGMVIGGVTNLNVPGDTNTTAGQITASMNFLNGDFVQNIAGNYLIVLSSPVGHFSAITNQFSVTNFPFGQNITGNVVSNSTPVPDAVVILFPPPRAGNHGPGNPLAGTVADNSGVYTIQLPPGTYVPVAFRNSYVANYGTSPVLTLAGSQTITTNLSLTAATSTISGQIFDAGNPSIGLPGVILPASTRSGLIAVGFSDTNGNFSIGVGSGQWSIGSDDSGLIVHGYVGYRNGTNVAAGATGIVGPYPKATAMFYGTVEDNLGNPLAGIDVQSFDNNNGEYQSDGYTDSNGDYFVGVVGGLGADDPWILQVDVNNSSPNYIYSLPGFDQIQPTGGTNIAVGQALQVNITAIPVAGHITGNVQSSGTNIAGVNVYAFATINGLIYDVGVDTDANGNYTLNVANAVWFVGVNCNGANGNDNLDNILGAGNYQCPNDQNVTNSGTANFNVIPSNSGQIYGYVKDTGNHPVTNVTVTASDGVGNNYSTNTDGNGYYSFIVGNGNWGVSVDCTGLNSQGYQCVSGQNVNVSTDVIEQDFIVQPNPIPVLSLPSWLTNRFSLQLAGVSNQNYTVQMSTNLATTNWVTLFITNNPANNSFLLTDPNATNKQRFYRILVGP